MLNKTMLRILTKSGLKPLKGLIGHRNCIMSRRVHRRKLYPLQCACRLKDDSSLLDGRYINTRRHAGILFTLIKSNHYKFPKNPYYRSMIEWNNLPGDLSLLPDKDAFS